MTIGYMGDESWDYLRKEETLKEILRSTPGVPNATYQARADGKIFVFNKLVSLMKGKDDVTADLLEKSHLTPTEAMREWQIIPHPYKIRTVNAAKDIVLWHWPFHSYIPCSSQRDLENKAETLLKGGVVEFPGDFQFQEQIFILGDDFALESLPPQPQVDPLPEIQAEPSPFNHVPVPMVREGFEAAPKNYLTALKRLATTWNTDVDQARAHVEKDLERLPKLISDLDCTAINRHYERPDNRPSFTKAEICSLRCVFPELQGCTDRALAGMRPCLHPLHPHRGLFILQQLIEPDTKNAPLPYFAALKILRGENLEKALAFEQTAQEYSNALSKRVFWTQSAFYFMRWAERNPKGKGPEITVTKDIIRQSRLEWKG